MRLIGAFVGGLVVYALEELLEAHDRLTGQQQKFEQFQAEQTARLWATRSDL